MTSGERRLALRLQEKLADDYLLWYDVPIGSKQLHPDFIILHPSRGLIVLEVKDWKPDTIQQVNPDSVQLVSGTGGKTTKHPLKQARDYALAIAQMLEQDTALIEAVGSRYQGKLVFPYGYGVVFTNITRKVFEVHEGLREGFQSNLVICQDEMYESVDAGEFQQQLWNLCTYHFGSPLSEEQINRIRWHLFPDIRIPSKQLDLLTETDLVEEARSPSELIPDLIRILDLQQEQLARSLGEGHRVIHGVAGSGKTLILAYRCLHLAQEVSKPILVLCFNVSLGSRLRHLMTEKGLSSKVMVRHFHGWCREQLTRYRIPKPDWKQLSAAEYNEQVVQKVIQSVDQGLIPAGSYGAVMIDEGHDFQPEWLKLVAQMVDAQTQSLLVLYDDAQNLYGEKKSKKFSFKSVGIQAQGRTTILKLNYRNTTEVLAVACEFAKEVMTPTSDREEDVPVLVQPQSVGRHGPLPELIHLPSFKQETDYLAERTQQFHERGVAWNDMAIVYRSKSIGEQIYKRFQQAQIPVEWVNKDTDSRFYNPAEQSIKLITMHASKGLEFPIVFVSGIGFMPMNQSPEAEEARLLYVAMTRAIDQLVMTCDRPSPFVQQMEAALKRAAGAA